MRTRLALLAALALALLEGCSTTRGVRPVGEGKIAAGLSVGGPVFTNLGAPIPTPLTSIYGRYGLDEKTDLDFALHVPVAASVGLDAGAGRLLLDQKGLRPAVMAGGRLLLFMNALWLTGAENPNGRDYEAGVRVMEHVYANASWKWLERSLVWVSFDLLAQIESAIVRPAIGVGAEWRPAALFGLTVEVRQLAFTTNQRFAAVDFIGPGDLGATSIQLGFNFYPGAE